MVKTCWPFRNRKPNGQWYGKHMVCFPSWHLKIENCLQSMTRVHYDVHHSGKIKIFLYQLFGSDPSLQFTAMFTVLKWWKCEHCPPLIRIQTHDLSSLQCSPFDLVKQEHCPPLMRVKIHDNSSLQCSPFWHKENEKEHCISPVKAYTNSETCAMVRLGLWVVGTVSHDAPSLKTLMTESQ